MRLLVIITFCLLSFTGYAQAIKVEVKEGPDGWYLERDGEPYYINGAGGIDNLDEMKYLGANSVRTWSLDDAEEVLDIAYENGLTVMMGLWVQHERHGFDYDNEEAVAQQLEKFTAAVRRFKDHPALLLWGIGNEVDLFYSNTKVWDAIQDIAAMIHRIDPNHPTSTVTAGFDSTECYLIRTRVPDLDIYGINTYGDIGKIKGDIRQFGWEGPYIISEWGPTGHWEVPKTEWGAPIEETSTEKAAMYRKRFNDYIKADRVKCIGSYVFLWGQKQETTSTWYGLFTEDGDPTELLDELYLAWRGEEPPNRSPKIMDFTLGGQKALDNIYVKTGEKVPALVEFRDPEGGKVKVDWYVYPESNAQSAGGDFESAIMPELGAVKNRRRNTATLVAPDKEGAYRLFVYVADKDKRTAYANIPFYVLPRLSTDPPARTVRFKKRELALE
jgi:hypothetical protein